MSGRRMAKTEEDEGEIQEGETHRKSPRRLKEECLTGRATTITEPAQGGGSLGWPERHTAERSGTARGKVSTKGEGNGGGGTQT